MRLTLRKKLCVCLALLFLETFAYAGDPKGWGLGLMLGGPTSFTAEHIFSEKNAFDLGIGWSGFWDWSMELYADYLYLFPGALHTKEPQINRIVPYAGFGALYVSYAVDHTHDYGEHVYWSALAGRIPLGLSWFVPDTRVQLFVEMIPTIFVLPGLFIGVGGGLGARYFF